MSSYLMSAPPMMICGINTSGTMLAAVFGSATSEETTRPSATPPIGHEHDREVNPKHSPDFENVIADQDEENALRQRENAKGNGFGKNIVRQPDIEIAFPLQNNPIADDVIGTVGQA